MYISCNLLKKYIENSDKIDWLDIWNKFTIRSAEIDGVTVVGNDINNVVVGEILNLEKHPKKDKYSIVTLNVGDANNITLISSATNLYKGMKVPCAMVGGSLKGAVEVRAAEFEGVMSTGVLASEKELGISDNHLGVMELPDNFPVGKDIKELMPIDDVIIEIDNKSLTNRPDMWGQYGIAREVSAITGNRLLPLPVFEDVDSGKEKLEVEVLDKENCNRYCGIKLSNITKKVSSLDMKIALYYCGMRSISLLVDLSNYLMLELGQPMHTFDARKIDKIVVKNIGNDKVKFLTLDGVERDIAHNTLMIYNGEEPVAIAGVMGGGNSEVEDDTSEIVLESANFDAASVRKSAVAIGLRTESSARFEKSLDPNMTELAIKRFIKLLKDVDENIVINSKMVDIYPNKVTNSIVHLKKSYLKKYMGFELEEKEVEKILKSLDFEVKSEKDEYVVSAPTYRSTKDISNQADIIEEISRIYGYENFLPVPLKLDLVIPHGENRFGLEYDIKKHIAEVTNFSEVHTYLWYQSDLLEQYKLNKDDNLKVVNKAQNNILRDDLTLSLFECALNNSKYLNEYGIFEIGTVMDGEGENRILSLLYACEDGKIQAGYMKIKSLANSILKKLNGEEAKFNRGKLDKKYLDNDNTIMIDILGETVGYISTFDKAFSKECGKKITLINMEINTEKLLKLKKVSKLYIEPSKFQTVTLDYTIILPKDEKYAKLEEILNKFESKLVISRIVKDIYEDESKKVTIRYTIGSNEKTLNQEEIQAFADDFVSYIEKFFNIVK